MKHYRKMTYPYVVWISVMIIVPMLLILFYAFTVDGNSVNKLVFSFENFAKFFKDKVFLEVLWKSFRVALITTVICLVLGYIPAYYIAKCSEGVKMKWVLLITFPTWINMLVRTYAWIGILQKDGIINKLLNALNLSSREMMYTEFAVVLGMVYNFLPFMILQIYTSLTKMDNSLVEAAADLGANRFQIFARVTFPLSIPGVISGITLVFLPAVSSFCIPKLLGGGQYMLVGNLIEKQFLTVGNWSFGSAISLIMTIIIMISMYLTKKFDKTEISEARSA